MNNNKIYNMGQRINAIGTKQANGRSAGKITDAYVGADGPGRLYMALFAQLYAN